MTKHCACKQILWLGACLAFAWWQPVLAEDCNIKVVTDGNPDYSDIGSMLHSITDNWQTDREKVWAIFYWNHFARRQTRPMGLHGLALTDPIRQFNDYGFTMCSTISGNNCAIFTALGLNVRYWDISNHTVMDVEYDGRYHLIDNSLSALYTLCDGKTLASVPDVGRRGSCACSGGKDEAGHIAKYHCLNATSPNGFVTGADDRRSLDQMTHDFDPNALKYRYYFNDWDLGHRFILNLRDNETYTRYYRRMDVGSSNAVLQAGTRDYQADPAYFVPNTWGCTDKGTDPESDNPRYHIRGNGIRSFVPQLTDSTLAEQAYGINGLTAMKPSGLQPAVAGTVGDAIFRIEGANVMTSLKIKAAFNRNTAADMNVLAISTDWGRTWTNVWTNDKTGDTPVSLNLIDAVNGNYDVLVKVSLMGKTSAAAAQLKSLAFETITQVNSKTQPKLKLGQNTVYVGTGNPTESIELWPDLRGDAWKMHVVDSKNIATYKNEKTGKSEHPGYMAVLYAADLKEPAYIVYKMDAPGDLTGLTYGGRFCNRAPQAHIEIAHSFDGGKTWTQTYSLTDNTSPWDVIHYEKATNVPSGARSVLVKYQWACPHGAADPCQCGLFTVHMEANYKPANTSFQPLEVAFTWREVQKDYTTITRSHVQKVEKTPFTYTIDVGGFDHPVMESLRINPVGAQPAPASYGYSDGKDVGGEKSHDRWFTDGKVLSVGMPYTTTEKSQTTWGAGDGDGKRLTSGIVGSSCSGGNCFSDGVLYSASQKPEVTVDLGTAQSCGAFRMAVSGYPSADALKGEIKDKTEVLTSLDGQNFTSAGFINFDWRFKDVPVNFMVPDDETMRGYNAPLILEKPIMARYVRFKITPTRSLAISQVQVLDKITYEPFDMRIALPDGKDRSDITAYPMKHTPSKPFVRD